MVLTARWARGQVLIDAEERSARTMRDSRRKAKCGEDRTQMGSEGAKSCEYGRADTLARSVYLTIPILRIASSAFA